jgi:hypothetical protein
MINRSKARQFLIDHANRHKPVLANGQPRFTSVSAAALDAAESRFREILRRLAENQCSKGRTIK